jgi:hypothetical protein
LYGDAVVAAGEGAFDGADPLAGEVVGVLFAGVDHDLQLGDPGGPGG